MTDRVREVLGEVDRPCQVCGTGLPIATETRRAGGLRNWLRNGSDRRVTRYETCLDCGVIVRVSTRNPKRVSGGNRIGPGYVAL